jgi:hypothetical protein
VLVSATAPVFDSHGTSLVDPSGRPLLLGPGRRLFSSTDIGIGSSSNSKAFCVLAVDAAAALAGAAARCLFKLCAPRRPVLPMHSGTIGPEAPPNTSMDQAELPQGPGRAPVGPVGQLGRRSTAGIVAEQVEAAVKGVAALLGLGAFQPVLGPTGQRLGLNAYGKLVPTSSKTPLTGVLVC